MTLYYGGYLVAGEWREGTVVDTFEQRACVAGTCGQTDSPHASVEYVNNAGRTETVTVLGIYEIGDTVDVRMSPLEDSALPSIGDALPGFVVGLIALFFGLWNSLGLFEAMVLDKP